MRGLPYTGKSYRANQLIEEAVEEGIHGKIFSTDEYWYKIICPEKPEEYTFKRNFLADAHRWNQQRTFRAIEMGEPLLIVDNTNTTADEVAPYVKYAYYQDYDISFEEPTSDRWKEIAQLLRSKRENKQALKDWAHKLEEGSKETHCVPFFAIEKMMWRWQCVLSVDDIMAKN